jgi:hypothetical protein
MILAIDSNEGILKIGSPPETLPGIVESVKINDSLLMEDTEVQGRSGRVKIVQGWDDAGLLISMSLIDGPGAGKTRWDYLKQITAAFKKVANNGKPEIYMLSHPMINAWGVRQLLFTSLETTESRTRRKITVALEFAEYDSSAGIVQERQENAAQAQQAAPEAAPAPIVSDQQRRGLGAMEARFANI